MGTSCEPPCSSCSALRIHPQRNLVPRLLELSPRSNLSKVPHQDCGEYRGISGNLNRFGNFKNSQIENSSQQRNQDSALLGFRWRFYAVKRILEWYFPNSNISPNPAGSINGTAIRNYKKRRISGTPGTTSWCQTCIWERCGERQKVLIGESQTSEVQEFQLPSPRKWMNYTGKLEERSRE